MKILPYLRFAWAIDIAMDFLSMPFPIEPEQAGDERFVGFLNATLLFKALFLSTFFLYCLVMGIQELMKKQLIEARFFYFFGILFEIFVFLAGLYLMNAGVGAGAEPWRIALAVIWQVLILLIIFIDIKRILAP